ncbi:MAG: hypothetical protein RIR65_2663 [Planctomycetota bacterium]|jgi:hypothetical protein
MWVEERERTRDVGSTRRTEEGGNLQLGIVARVLRAGEIQ